MGPIFLLRGIGGCPSPKVMFCGFTYPLEGVHGLEILGHCILIVDFSDLGGLAARRVHEALFRNLGDGAVERAEPVDDSLLYLAQPENEIF